MSGFVNDETDILVAEESVSDTTHYVDGAELVPFPPRPSDLHVWDWDTKAWVRQVDLWDLVERRHDEVDRERARRNNLAITYDGKLLDGDARAQTNLSNKIVEVDKRLARGIAMPAQLLVWRDADNVTHIFPDLATYSTWLDGFAIALAERGTLLYAVAWQHKANLEALTDIDDILNYDVTAGWPE